MIKLKFPIRKRTKISLVIFVFMIILYTTFQLSVDYPAYEEAVYTIAPGLISLLLVYKDFKLYNKMEDLKEQINIRTRLAESLLIDNDDKEIKW